jgi:hypothetical protein
LLLILYKFFYARECQSFICFFKDNIIPGYLVKIADNEKNKSSIARESMNVNAYITLSFRISKNHGNVMYHSSKEKD